LIFPGALVDPRVDVGSADETNRCLRIAGLGSLFEGRVQGIELPLIGGFGDSDPDA
jgi:hypothetical protein